MDDWHIGAGFRPVSYSLHGDKGFRNRAVTHPPQRAPQRADGHFPQSTRSEGPKQSAPALHLRIAPRNRLARGETVCESPHTTVCCITRAKLYNLLYMATNGHHWPPTLGPLLCFDCAYVVCLACRTLEPLSRSDLFSSDLSQLPGISPHSWDRLASSVHSTRSVQFDRFSSRELEYRPVCTQADVR